MTRPKRGVGVRWGRQELVFQRGGNMATAFFSQALAAVMVVLLTATHAEARKGADLRAAVQASASLPCYWFTQRALQGLRNRPHRPDCLPWGRCTEEHAVADRCRRERKRQVGAEGVRDLSDPPLPSLAY